MSARRANYVLTRRFALLHPAVMMVFFIAVIVVSLISYHPLVLMLSFALAALSVGFYLGFAALMRTFAWLLPMAIVVVAFNVLLNRRGATELTTVNLSSWFAESQPNWIPTMITQDYTFTAESLIYGSCIAVMLMTVVLWFCLYQKFMTSDRFLYLVAPIAPTLALSVAMVQRWMMLVGERWTAIRNAEKMMSDKQRAVVGFKARYQALVSSFSALMSWSMEDAIVAADSMQARGYNSSERKRSSFRSYRFSVTDLILLALIVFLTLGAGVGILITTRSLAFFPVIRGTNQLSILAVLAALILMLMPLLLEAKGGLQCVQSSVRKA